MILALVVVVAVAMATAVVPVTAQINMTVPWTKIRTGALHPPLPHASMLSMRVVCAKAIPTTVDRVSGLSSPLRFLACPLVASAGRSGC
jgi:hypothetical protein